VGQLIDVDSRVREPQIGERLKCPGVASALETRNPPFAADFDGAYRDRTGDLRLAKPALSQLS
jgi:hypothetical protein